MSTQVSPSPPRQSVSPQVDESQLPKGQCRYILLLPEIKGQRCACVNFTLNRAMPSATCDCGHLACYHISEVEQPVDQKEMAMLRQRLSFLEDRVTSDQEEGGPGSLVTRVSELEERLDRSREEFAEQIRGAYRNITRSWSSITELERRNSQVDQRLRQTDVHLKDVDAEIQRLSDGQLELADADISLEERIENVVDMLEDAGSNRADAPRERRPRRRSTSDSNRPSNPLGGGTVRPRLGSRSLVQRPRSLVDSAGSPASLNNDPNPTPTSVPPFRPAVTSAPAPPPPPGTWTVHVSLLPNASLPFPFERNTNAYQRCLSRGLHRTVAIPGPDSGSFVAAVSQAFEDLLKGRPWMPLQAKLCNAEQLRGLPMLRPLDVALADFRRYDAAFLQQHCAVCDPGGNIDSLYIAMRTDTLSWHALKQAPVWMEGLEASWAYDPLLDAGSGDHPFSLDGDGGEGDDDDDDDDADLARPAAGDIIVTALPPSLKRAASEMSRSASFGAATAPVIVEGGAAAAGEGPLVKRSCPPQNTIVEVRRRGVETV